VTTVAGIGSSIDDGHGANDGLTLKRQFPITRRPA
jgi:hypothetical protein